jgi:glutamate N-acetyltransferase/amino-acid N-acetyltransferase
VADGFSLDAEPAELADVAGFRTGAASAGLLEEGPDVAVILCEDERGVGTAVFSENAVRAAPVRVSSPRAAARRLRAAVVNSGNANCLTGEKGLEAARAVVAAAAEALGVPQEQIVVASTGPAGVPLPADRVKAGAEAASRDAREKGRGDAATVVSGVGARRLASASGTIDGKPFRIAGVSKGASILRPGMAQMFAFLATDAAVGPECLREILQLVYERTFARLVVDGETSSNDTFCVLASGRAGNEPLDNIFSAGVFAEALSAVAKRLAIDTAFEGDPASRLLEVQVSGATDESDAEIAARSVAQSILVRTAVHVGAPSWPRVLAAAGRSGARVTESRAAVRFGGHTVFERGTPVEPVPAGVAEAICGPVALVELDLGLGEGSAVAWSSDLSDGEVDTMRELEDRCGSAETARKEMSRRLKESEAEAITSSREAKKSAEKALAEAKAAAGSEAAALKKKLEESESARDAAQREAKVLRVRLELAEKGGKGKRAAKEVEKLTGELREGKERAEGEAKELRERLKSAEREVARLKKAAGKAPAKAEAEAPPEALPSEELRSLKAEVEKLKAQISLKDQLVQQMLAEDKGAKEKEGEAGPQ